MVGRRQGAAAIDLLLQVLGVPRARLKRLVAGAHLVGDDTRRSSSTTKARLMRSQGMTVGASAKRMSTTSAR